MRAWLWLNELRRAHQRRRICSTPPSSKGDGPGVKASRRPHRQHRPHAAIRRSIRGLPLPLSFAVKGGLNRIDHGPTELRTRRPLLVQAPDSLGLFAGEPFEGRLHHRIYRGGDHQGQSKPAARNTCSGSAPAKPSTAALEHRALHQSFVPAQLRPNIHKDASTSPAQHQRRARYNYGVNYFNRYLKDICGCPKCKPQTARAV